MKNTVSIIIPNWNGKELLQKHLPYVIKASENSQIIVVDDKSDDDSVAFVRNTYPSVQVVDKQRHEGYASTVNAGVIQAQGEVVVLLNTDVSPQKDFLKPLLAHFDDQNVFAVGCMDKSVEGAKVILRGRGLARWEKGFYIHERGDVDATDTAWVSGGSGAFRKYMWDKLRGMDTSFDPFYWEDIDLSYRARKKGYRLIFEPKSIVSHYHQEGKILDKYSSATIKRISYRNQFIFIWKHVRGLQLLLHCFWTPIRIIQALRRSDFAMIMGYIEAIGYIPRILRYRSR